MSARKVTKHPGSKKPQALNYRGNAVEPLSSHHKGYHAYPGTIPRLYQKAKKGSVWRAATRPLRRMPGWQKRAQNGNSIFRQNSGTEAE